MSPSNSSILIVDEQIANLRLLRDLLAEKGYYTRSVREEATRRIREMAGGLEIHGMVRIMHGR